MRRFYRWLLLATALLWAAAVLLLAAGCQNKEPQISTEYTITDVFRQTTYRSSPEEPWQPAQIGVVFPSPGDPTHSNPSASEPT